MLSRALTSLALFLTLCVTGTEAFVSPAVTVVHSPTARGTGTASAVVSTTTTVLSMSASPADDENLGATERLLLEKARARELGLVQEYGRTIKKDGLDGVRAVVWGIFHVSQGVFGVLAIALMASMALHMAGYGYYWDDAGGFHVDVLANVQQLHIWQEAEESARLAASAVEQSALLR